MPISAAEFSVCPLGKEKDSGGAGPPGTPSGRDTSSCALRITVSRTETSAVNATVANGQKLRVFQLSSAMITSMIMIMPGVDPQKYRKSEAENRKGDWFSAIHR